MAALDASSSRIPVLLGGCGSGRTTLLQQLRDRVGRTATQYVDVDRTATTPERFLRAVTTASPFAPLDSAPAGTRAAFDATLTFFSRAKAAGSVRSKAFPDCGASCTTSSMAWPPAAIASC
jgi:hypothetical protein